MVRRSGSARLGENHLQGKFHVTCKSTGSLRNEGNPFPLSLYVVFPRLFVRHLDNERSMNLSLHSNKMSTISIATLSQMSRDTLAALLSAETPANKLAIIDVRDSGE